jgi:hypothetical protein
MNVLIAADAAKRRFKMKAFTIENETNNITIHTTAQEAEAKANAERFRNEAAWRSWPPIGPHPAWSISGTACRAPPR